MHPHPGDLVLLSVPTRRRVAMVVRVGPAAVVVMLCHPFPELASDLDLVVHRLPYALVVQPELYATVAPEAVVRLLGRVSATELAALEASLASDGESVESLGSWALPLGGADDPRRHHKRDELDELACFALPTRPGGSR